ncbi:unnamed protein product [Paramecium sonneborni]|uniref:Uncharacterized protein n=1 Tax=Paramecium sonneborni TaxID=65129 RepID=A0A8S1R0L2_9CILI|nr:unnamed protein product [Paramecium sonneborni]
MRKEKILDNLQFISYIHFITIQLQTRGNINHYQQKISDVIKKLPKSPMFQEKSKIIPIAKKITAQKLMKRKQKIQQRKQQRIRASQIFKNFQNYSLVQMKNIFNVVQREC